MKYLILILFFCSSLAAQVTGGSGSIGGDLQPACDDGETIFVKYNDLLENCGYFDIDGNPILPEPEDPEIGYCFETDTLLNATIDSIALCLLELKETSEAQNDTLIDKLCDLVELHDSLLVKACDAEIADSLQLACLDSIKVNQNEQTEYLDSILASLNDTLLVEITNDTLLVSIADTVPVSLGDDTINVNIAGPFPLEVVDSAALACLDSLKQLLNDTLQVEITNCPEVIAVEQLFDIFLLGEGSVGAFRPDINAINVQYDQTGVLSVGDPITIGTLSTVITSLSTFTASTGVFTEIQVQDTLPNGTESATFTTGKTVQECIGIEEFKIEQCDGSYAYSYWTEDGNGVLIEYTITGEPSFVCPPAPVKEIVTECVQLKPYQVQYNNDPRGCGTTNVLWQVAAGCGPANYSNWSFEYDGQNFIPAGSNSFSVTATGGAGWNQNFTLTNPVMTANNPAGHTWDWTNEGKPCYRVWSTIVCDDSANGYGVWEVDIERCGKARSAYMEPLIIEFDEIYLQRQLCYVDCEVVSAEFATSEGEVIADLLQYVSEESGIPLVDLIKFYPTEDDLAKCLKPCTYEYAPSADPLVSCETESLEFCDNDAGTVTQFIREITRCFEQDGTEFSQSSEDYELAGYGDPDTQIEYVPSGDNQYECSSPDETCSYYCAICVAAPPVVYPPVKGGTKKGKAVATTKACCQTSDYLFATICTDNNTGDTLSIEAFLNDQLVTWDDIDLDCYEQVDCESKVCKPDFAVEICSLPPVEIIDCPKVIDINTVYDYSIGGGGAWTLFTKIEPPHPDYTDVTWIGDLLTSATGNSTHPAGPDQGNSINGWHVYSVCAETQPIDDSNAKYWIAGAPSLFASFLTYDGTPAADLAECADSLCLAVREILTEQCDSTITVTYLRDSLGVLVDYTLIGEPLQECPSEPECPKVLSTSTVYDLIEGGEAVTDPCTNCGTAELKYLAPQGISWTDVVGFSRTIRSGSFNNFTSALATVTATLNGNPVASTITSANEVSAPMTLVQGWNVIRFDLVDADGLTGSIQGWYEVDATGALISTIDAASKGMGNSVTTCPGMAIDQIAQIFRAIGVDNNTPPNDQLQTGYATWGNTTTTVSPTDLTNGDGTGFFNFAQNSTPPDCPFEVGHGFTSAGGREVFVTGSVSIDCDGVACIESEASGCIAIKEVITEQCDGSLKVSYQQDSLGCLVDYVPANIVPECPSEPECPTIFATEYLYDYSVTSCDEVGSFVSVSTLGISSEVPGSATYRLRWSGQSVGEDQQILDWLAVGYYVTVEVAGVIGVIGGPGGYTIEAGTPGASWGIYTDHTAEDPCGIYATAVNGGGTQGARTWTAYVAGGETCKAIEKIKEVQCDGSETYRYVSDSSGVLVAYELMGEELRDCPEAVDSLNVDFEAICFLIPKVSKSTETGWIDVYGNYYFDDRSAVPSSPQPTPVDCECDYFYRVENICVDISGDENLDTELTQIVEGLANCADAYQSIQYEDAGGNPVVLTKDQAASIEFCDGLGNVRTPVCYSCSFVPVKSSTKKTAAKKKAAAAPCAYGTKLEVVFDGAGTVIEVDGTAATTVDTTGFSRVPCEGLVEAIAYVCKEVCIDGAAVDVIIGLDGLGSYVSFKNTFTGGAVSEKEIDFSGNCPPISCTSRSETLCAGQADTDLGIAIGDEIIVVFTDCTDGSTTISGSTLLSNPTTSITLPDGFVFQTCSSSIDTELVGCVTDDDGTSWNVILINGTTIAYQNQSTNDFGMPVGTPTPCMEELSFVDALDGKHCISVAGDEKTVYLFLQSDGDLAAKDVETGDIYAPDDFIVISCCGGDAITNSTYLSAFTANRTADVSTTGWATQLTTGAAAISGDFELCFTPTDNGGNSPQMVGMNTDPNTDANWTSIDHALYFYVLNGAYQLRLYESAAFTQTLSTASWSGQEICYERVGTDLTISMAGTDLITVTTTAADLFLDDSHYYAAGTWGAGQLSYSDFNLVSTVAGSGEVLSFDECLLTCVVRVDEERICADGSDALRVSRYDTKGVRLSLTFEKPDGTVFTPSTYNDCGGGLTVTTNDVGVLFAYGQQDTNTNGDLFNTTIARTAVGRYTVTFGQAHPNGDDYSVTFGQEEPVNTRDAIDPHVVDGSRTPTGFDVWLGTGDNGAGADILVDEPWSFQVAIDQTVVTSVTNN